LKFLARTALFAAAGILIWVLGCRQIVHSWNLWKKSLKKHTAFPETPGILFVIAWFLVTFLPVSMGGRFFFHYYVQLLPPLCVLAAMGVEV
jgi:hypothetical protein